MVLANIFQLRNSWIKALNSHLNVEQDLSDALTLSEVIICPGGRIFVHCLFGWSVYSEHNMTFLSFFEGIRGLQLCQIFRFHRGFYITAIYEWGTQVCKLLLSLRPVSFIQPIHFWSNYIYIFYY